MHLTWTNLAWSLLWGLVGGTAVWLILLPLRRRSLTGLLAALVLTGAAASTGAQWGAVHTMLVSWQDWKTMLALTAFSAAAITVAAVAVGRRLRHDNAALRSAISDFAAGRVPEVQTRRLTAEVEATRRELATTAATLAATRDRERRLEAARRELVSWVSHDLRTPLAGLRAMAEALEDGVVDDPELYYKRIGASVDQLNQMVEDLFDLSRIQAGITPRDEDEIALDDLVSDCLAALEPLATAQGVQLAGTVDAAAAVTGSGTELNRALTNLVANAIRHTRAEGHVTVRVGLTRVDATDFAHVDVSDECGGIPEDHLARVFDVGFRGEAARTPDADDLSFAHTGAGLGLAITRGIVEAHAGTVDVHNTGSGCRFRVRLPALGQGSSNDAG